MEKIIKNSKVIISDSRDLWNNKTGIVISNNINYSDNESQVKVKTQLNNEKFVIQTFQLKNLKLIADLDESKQEINENTSSDYIKDIIKPYLLVSDFDNEFLEESWFFIDKIAVAENLDCSEVISIAKSLKYPVYCIKTYNKKIYIVADKKISKDMIEDDYGRFLLGYKGIERI